MSSAMSAVARLANGVGRGILAGAVGTAALTLMPLLPASR